MRSLSLLLLVAGLFLAPAQLRAQDDPFEKEIKELNSRVTARLLNFARKAEHNKVRSRAREAYKLIVDEYDRDNSRAYKALGYTKEDGEWTAPTLLGRWSDEADDEHRFEVLDEWNSFAEGIGKLHRELGLKMIEQGHLARGTYHLQRAVYYNPFDADAHKGLEHEEVDGFWGTPEDVAFVKRLKELELKAVDLAKTAYEVEELPQSAMPAELRKIFEEDQDYEFFGAKSANFEIWTRGNVENAVKCVQWAERACDWVEFILPDDVRIDLRATCRQRWAWMGFVWTRAEQKALLRLNPHIDGDAKYRNVAFMSPKGPVTVWRALTNVSRYDTLVGNVVNLLRGTGNDAICEGLIHASTWYTMGTNYTRFGADAPNRTTTGKEVTLPDAGAWWVREMRDQATSGTDFPLASLPRVQLHSFPSDARLKSWSFHMWLLARYPEKWWEWFTVFSGDEQPFPAKVEEYGEKIFERPLAEVEAEWRWWAAGRSGTASATGYGPPLLPEAPNRDQIRGLERLNEFRAMAGLPPGEIDLEATEACKKHALYLQAHTDQWVWPDAHEEYPDREGFTIQGLRAGQQSEIILSEGDIDAADSLDGWMGTIYHRFSLIYPETRRIGFGHVGNVVVLDTGSLRDPLEEEDREAFKWIPWPPDGMVDVPRNFHFTEHPDPLQYTDEGRAAPFEHQKKVGYPVSLQMLDGVAAQVTGGTISLFECKRQGRGFARDRTVPCFIHLPDKPLNKDHERTSVFFAIPKEPLEPKTVYEAEVVIRIEGGSQNVTWRFMTGTRRVNHGRLREPDPEKLR